MSKKPHQYFKTTIPKPSELRNYCKMVNIYSLRKDGFYNSIQNFVEFSGMEHFLTFTPYTNLVHLQLVSYPFKQNSKCSLCHQLFRINRELEKCCTGRADTQEVGNESPLLEAHLMVFQ